MRKRFTEEQIVKILQEHAEGKTVGEVCRNNGISENTFYIWKRRYGSMQVSDVIKLKTLQSENERLKRPVAELSLENMAQKDVIKKLLRPGTLRKTADYVIRRFGLSQRKACRFLSVSRTALRYVRKKKDDGKILHEIKRILSRHPRSGCQMVYMKLRQSM